MATSDDAIFLLDAHDRLTVAPVARHKNEADFQALLELHPRLLAGARIRPSDPLRWLLVKREATVPDTDTGQGRWSLDHLFVDQDGTPTLVEVKRASDTRLRREVVGQVLDYAANAQLHWSSDVLRGFAEATHGSASLVNDRVVELLAIDSEDPEASAEAVERWWEAVEDKLQRGVVRLLFVADAIPSELKRIIEFLNEHMQNVEVLGIEISQYADGATRVLVPRVVGQTETAVAQKSRGSLRPSPVRRTIAEIIDSAAPHVAALMKWLVSEAEKRGMTVTPGTRGFSARSPGNEPAVSYYLYPERVDGGDEAYAEIYFPKAWGPERIDAERSRLAGLDPRRMDVAGQYTVRVRLADQEACDLLRRAVIESLG